jgi:hypothetical protein
MSQAETDLVMPPSEPTGMRPLFVAAAIREAIIAALGDPENTTVCTEPAFGAQWKAMVVRRRSPAMEWHTRAADFGFSEVDALRTLAWRHGVKLPPDLAPPAT